MLDGCTSPSATVQPGSVLNVLGPDPRFSTDALPSDWVVIGAAGPNQLSVARSGGVPSLRIASGAEDLFVVRRTEALMLATPYLSWAWNMAPYENSFHPIHLVVGFRDGRSTPSTWQRLSSLTAKGKLPIHDRALRIAWAGSALRRGVLSRLAVDGDETEIVRYTVRGGRENTGSWWLETVDLSRIYADAWPGNGFEHVRIAFIGIAAAGGPFTSSALVSGIRLSR